MAAASGTCACSKTQPFKAPKHEMVAITPTATPAGEPHRRAAASAIGAEDFTGAISEIAPVADPATRTFLVKLDLPAHDGLRSGQFGHVLVPVGAVVVRGPSAEGAPALIFDYSVRGQNELGRSHCREDKAAERRVARVIIPQRQTRIGSRIGLRFVPQRGKVAPARRCYSVAGGEVAEKKP